MRGLNTWILSILQYNIITVSAGWTKSAQYSLVTKNFRSKYLRKNVKRCKLKILTFHQPHFCYIVYHTSFCEHFKNGSNHIPITVKFYADFRNAGFIFSSLIFNELFHFQDGICHVKWRILSLNILNLRGLNRSRVKFFWSFRLEMSTFIFQHIQVPSTNFRSYQFSVPLIFGPIIFRSL